MELSLVAIDPSGNKGKEGNGITGMAFFRNGVLEKTAAIRAEEYRSIEEYWWMGIRNEMMKWFLSIKSDTLMPRHVVCESYRLQAGKQMAQTWSSLETPQLIGFLRMECYNNHIKFHLQEPSIKVRWNDEILENMGIVERRDRTKKLYFTHSENAPSLDHERDAVRHGLHAHKYGGFFS